MKRYQRAAAARLDLLQIWNYVCAHASDEVADHVHNDLVAYDPAARPLAVARLVHGMRDLPAVFPRV